MRELLLDGIDEPRVGSESRHLIWHQAPGRVPVATLTELGRNRLCSNLAVMEPRTAWPDDFIALLAERLPRANPPCPAKGWEFHLVSLLWDLQPIAFRRTDITAVKAAMFSAFASYPWEDGLAHPEWFPSVSPDEDVIQHVNKSGQWGVKHQTLNLETPEGAKSNFYLLRRPLEFDHAGRGIRRDAKVPLKTWTRPSVVKAIEPTNEMLLTSREDVLSYLIENWINVPATKWSDNGHRDPDNKETGGMCCQPEGYNRKQKAKFKFDKYGLPLCPTVTYLTSDVSKFYPSDDERRRLLKALQESLGDAASVPGELNE